MDVLIFSHGFGVRKDDRGLFPDIAAGVPEAEAIMFDYNHTDEATDTLFATTLSKQAEKLRQVYAETRAKQPSATIDLICHSQGCVIAAMAQLNGIHKTIFLAPPDASFGTNIDQKIEDMKNSRSNTEVLSDGSISYPRRDGSTTIIPQMYWDGRKNLNPIPLYAKLAENTELTIIQATNDEVIGMTNFSELPSDVKIIQMNTGHDFEGAIRAKMIRIIAQEIRS
jgi:hypothetical protein